MDSTNTCLTAVSLTCIQCIRVVLLGKKVKLYCLILYNCSKKNHMEEEETFCMHIFSPFWKAQSHIHNVVCKQTCCLAEKYLRLTLFKSHLHITVKGYWLVDGCFIPSSKICFVFRGILSCNPGSYENHLNVQGQHMFSSALYGLNRFEQK